MVYVFVLAGLAAATALQAAAALPPYALWAMLALYAALCLSFRPHAARVVGIALLGAAVLGAWAQWRAELRLLERLPAALENRDLEFEGTLVDLVEHSASRARLSVRLDDPGDSGLPPGMLLQLNDYRFAAARPGVPAAIPPYLGGQRWRFTARLKRPHGQLNPGGQDYEAWLWAHGYGATGSVKAALRLGEAGDFAARLSRLRQTLSASIAAHLRGRPAAALVAALVVGDDSGIARADWETFSATGVTHLVSISGLHITLIAGLSAVLTRFAFTATPLARLGIGAASPALIAGLGAGLIYALLAGFSVPTQRTLYMLIILALGRVWRGKSILESLAYAALAALVFDPFAVLTVGFWLSFGAVACMTLGAHGRIGRPVWWREWGRAQWAVALGLAPALALAFQQYPWISPLSNAVAIPVVSGIVTPLALAGGLAEWPTLLRAAEAVAALLLALLRQLARAGLLDLPSPPPAAAAVAVCGTVLALLPAGLPGRRLGLIAVLLLACGRSRAPGEGEWRATVFDVGQGLSVLVQTRTRALLYDSGPDWPGEGDSGGRVLIPALRALGVRRLDRLILSHDDLDHTGGAASLLRAVPIAAVQSDLPDGHALWRTPARAERLPCRQAAWTWDGVEFRVMAPLPGRTADNDNDNSCVVRIRGAHARLLLSGDIGRGQELELVDHWGDELRAQALIAPHHGSRNASTPEFIGRTRPDIVVFSAGYLNRFRHPHPDTLERYRGRRIRRTDQDGAIELVSGPGGVDSSTERGTAPRFWRHGPASAP